MNGDLESPCTISTRVYIYRAFRGSGCVIVQSSARAGACAGAMPAPSRHGRRMQLVHMARLSPPDRRTTLIPLTPGGDGVWYGPGACLASASIRIAAISNATGFSPSHRRVGNGTPARNSLLLFFPLPKGSLKCSGNRVGGGLTRLARSVD